jgi:hypothetical protein
MKVEVLIVVLELCQILVTTFDTLFFGHVNKIGAAVGDQDVADLAHLLLIVVAESHTTGFAQLRNLSLHRLILFSHDFHLVL